MLNTTNRRLMTLFLVVSCVPLLIYFYASFNARLSADDYCVLPAIQNRGLLNTQLFYYESWTGRFTHIIANTSALRLGIAFGSFIPIAAITLWWIALFGAVRAAVRKRDWPSPVLLAATAATLLMITILNGTFGVRDSLYWTEGILLYTAPLILLTFYLWLVISYDAANVPLLILAFLITFFAAGFSELYAPLQFLVLAGGIIYCLRYGRQRLSVLAVGLVATLIATAILLGSPGTSVRIAHNLRPDIASLVEGSLVGPFATAGITAFIWPFSPLLMIGLAILVGYYLESRKYEHIGRILLAIPVVCGLLTAIPFGITLVATGQRPPDRAWIIPEITLFCGYMLWGYFLGVALRPEGAVPKLPALLRLVMVIAGAAIIVMTFTKAVSLETSLRAFADAWDQRNAYIQSQVGKTAILTLKPIPYGAAEIDVATNSDFWVNRCMAIYYHFDAIAGDPTVTKPFDMSGLIGAPPIPG